MPLHDTLVQTLLTTASFVVLGLFLFGLAFFVIVKVTPFSIRKEIEVDQNTSLAILIASVFLGIAIIIGAAIHG
ncbi:MAG: DUF350 domain-containing protein [Polyangiaceae bacterium]